MVQSTMVTRLTESNAYGATHRERTQSRIGATVTDLDIMDCVPTDPFRLLHVPKLSVAAREGTDIRGLSASFREYNGVVKKHFEKRLSRYSPIFLCSLGLWCRLR